MKPGIILLKIAILSICCQKINNEISVPLVSSAQLPNCQSEKFTFVPPNLSNLTEGIDYILISPNIISGINNNEQFKGNHNTNLPPCNTWNTLIHDKLLLNPSIKYILFQPGDYRCLGPLYLANIPINPDSTINGINGRELNQINKCNAPTWTIPTPILSLLFYDFYAIDKFTPIDQFTETQGNAYIDRQVVLQGMILDGCSNILVRGIIFDPIQQYQIVFDIKYFSENNIVELCKFINFPNIGIQVRSSKNILQDNKFINANPVNPQCNDPVSIYLHCDHKTRGDYNTQLLIYPCFSNKIIDNIFRNAGQAIQTGYHRGESYNPVENSTPNYYNYLNYELASVSNTLICGNISFKTPDKYGKYEDDFTFKIGSQCKLKPVFVFENYCWGNRTWNQSCGNNKSDGNIGDAMVIFGWASNLLIYNNYIDNSINGISGISLKTDAFFSNPKQYYWNINNNCISNIITGSGYQYSASDYRSAGFLWPGRYTISTSLYLQNNTFINVQDPTVLEDISSDCPPPNLQLEPNFNPNLWGGIQTNINFLTKINNACPVWTNYTPIQFDEYLEKYFIPPSKSFFNFRTKFLNEPNINCCN